MELKILKYLSVMGGTMLKFIFGPTIGFASQLSYWETVLFSFLGMMTAVVAVTFLGLPFRRFLIQKFMPNAKKFTPRKRMLVKVWKKYGITGIAFLTPLILTPIGGTIIAVSFGEKSYKIVLFMLVSAAIWSIVISAGVFFAGSFIK
jgi:hypothetical protein